MIDRNRVNERTIFSIERAEQAMRIRGLSRLETARRMGIINGGKYTKENDGKGCYKALSKALLDGLMSDKMLDRFCEVVNVNSYVIRGTADDELSILYETNSALCDCGSLEDYKKSLDLDLYPYEGPIRRILETYEPCFLEGSEIFNTYNQLIKYFGVKWIDIQASSNETQSNAHSKEYYYYLLMDNILDAVRNCIVEFGEKPQTGMVYTLEQVDDFINKFRVELYNNGLLE